MKILVTGGGGFLGQVLCRNLVERGFDVVSFNRGRYDALDAMGERARSMVEAEFNWRPIAQRIVNGYRTYALRDQG